MVIRRPLRTSPNFNNSSLSFSFFLFCILILSSKSSSSFFRRLFSNICFRFCFLKISFFNYKIEKNNKRLKSKIKKKKSKNLMTTISLLKSRSAFCLRSASLTLILARILFLRSSIFCFTSLRCSSFLNLFFRFPLYF